jgi:hypothetical protein
MSVVMNAPVVKLDEDRPSVSPPARASFWSRHKTLVNFWLDCTLMILFLVQSWLLAIVALVFPRSSHGWTLWGANAGDWLDALFMTSCAFAVGIVLHVMLHWSWVCGTISTKLLGRKAGKDDGTQTLIGVGFLILLLHILGAAVLAAKVGLIRPH